MTSCTSAGATCRSRAPARRIPWTTIDLAANGRVVAVEFVNVETAGVDPAGVPEWEAIERLIRDAGIQLPATAKRG